MVVKEKQDLYDPGVVAAFAQRVGTERRLTRIICSPWQTSVGAAPSGGTPGKRKLLEDLRASVRTCRAGAPQMPQPRLKRKREALILLASQRPARTRPNKHLWQTLDVSFIYAPRGPDIAWHIAPPAAVGSPTAIVRTRLSLAGEGLEVLIYSLIARTCLSRLWLLSAAVFPIRDARIHTTTDGHALDAPNRHHITKGTPYRELMHQKTAGPGARFQTHPA